MVSRVFRFTSAIFLLLILSAIAYLNQALYYRPSITTYSDDVNINADLLAEIRGLKEALAKGGATDMQRLFPEGYVFMNALYALTWADFISEIKDDPDLYRQDEPNLYSEALKEIESSYRNIDSQKAWSIFNRDLRLPYGAFYNGWRNLVLAKKLAVEIVDLRDSSDVAAFTSQCDTIASVIAAQDQFYPSSYSNGTWPADVVICVASLAIYDKLYPPKYQAIISTWMKKVKNNLDDNGLIPHAVDSKSGDVIEEARGSSMSLMLIFLKDIDVAFAKEQFGIYKSLFLDSRFGLPGIREYPKENSGKGDVDSGPVILQIGASATIVGMRTMNEFGEESISVALRNGIESFGMPVESEGKKKYLFGKLPMADAFVAWAHAADPLLMRSDLEDKSWRYKFHLYSLLLASPFIFLLMKVSGFRFKRRSK